MKVVLPYPFPLRFPCNCIKRQILHRNFVLLITKYITIYLFSNHVKVVRLSTIIVACHTVVYQYHFFLFNEIPILKFHLHHHLINKIMSKESFESLPFKIPYLTIF